jgi:crotonobetainyl-CoA:carnitine CoA-transferase CaiB-like acyl-CoA transferase
VTSARWPSAVPGVGPLAGVRVVELGTFISGPFAAMALADLGADVLKVEPPSGDPLRRFGRTGKATSPAFLNVNRGKRSVCLDLKDPGAAARLRDVLDAADVLVCNWRASVAGRLGILDDELAERNPRLVRLYLTGYGLQGPLADAPSFDSVLQARSGLADVMRRDDVPQLLPMYLVDKLAGVVASQAVLAALVGRSATGRGERIDLAMLDAAAYLDFPEVMTNRTYLDHADLPARNDQAAAIRPVRAADGWLVAAAVTGDQVRRACAALGADELAGELLAMPDATALTRRFCDEVERRTRMLSLDDALARLAAADVPATACLSLDEHLADEQVAVNQLYRVVDREDLGAVREVRYPARFSSTGDLWPATAAPALGRHTTDVVPS